jgi:paraquat-inducible protein A
VVGTLSAMAIGCEVCGLLNLAAIDGVSRCQRCDTPLSARKPQSSSRAWAYLLTAICLYLPANIYPVIETRTILGAESHTIVGGVIELWRGGSQTLALLVFFASILVPVLKILAMALLLLTVRRRSSWRLRERAELFRLIEFFGRWSMLDIYVVALLVALVRLQSVATIDAGTGALAFGAVVVLTMLSTQSFDPRLIWDAAGANGPNPTTAR